MNHALDYMRVKGLATDKCFEYKGDNETCEKMCKDPVKEKVGSYCVVFGEDDIKREIMKNGPVVAVTQVYSDFLSYKKGVYTKGDDVPRFSGMTSVKVIGWGVESGSESELNQGSKYWIIENTWGEGWGENGYAKISSGQEFFFEQYAYSIKTQNELLKAQAAANAKAKDGSAKKKEEDIPDMN